MPEGAVHGVTAPSGVMFQRIENVAAASASTEPPTVTV